VSLVRTMAAVSSPGRRRRRRTPTRRHRRGRPSSLTPSPTKADCATPSGELIARVSVRLGGSVGADAPRGVRRPQAPGGARRATRATSPVSMWAWRPRRCSSATRATRCPGRRSIGGIESPLAASVRPKTRHMNRASAACSAGIRCSWRVAGRHPPPRVRIRASTDRAPGRPGDHGADTPRPMRQVRHASIAGQQGADPALLGARVTYRSGRSGGLRPARQRGQLQATPRLQVQWSAWSASTVQHRGVAAG
jgi:hypothetical protein